MGVMATYKEREFTFRFIENTPENEAEIVGFGFDPSGFYPGFGVRVNIERGSADLISAEDFLALYEEIPEE